MPIIHQAKKLGKRRQRVDSRTFKLSRYLTPALPPPPPKAGYIGKVYNWPMYLNDLIGDCVPAATAHMIEQWTTYSGRPTVLTNDDVVRAYTGMAGYDPNDPSTDNGTEMLTALNYWRHKGVGEHKIVAYAQVNPKNLTEVKQAVYLFGNLIVGAQLPVSVQDSATLWEVPHYGLTGDGSAGSWGGHCVPIVGYGLTGMKVVSWGSLVSMTWNFLQGYCDEIYAVLSQDWFETTGEAINGFNFSQLQADLGML